MSTRAQKVRLGVFMILATLLFLGSVGTLAGVKLLNPQDIYYVRFTESVSGLEVGSVVKMKGVRVGQVMDIDIGVDVESVKVKLALKPSTPITVDTQAVMTAIGITGLQFVELTGGSASAKRIPPNTPKSFIEPGKSMLRSLTGKAESIAVKMEAVLNNLLSLTDESNRVRVAKLLDDTDGLAVEARATIKENRPRLERIFTSMDNTTKVLEKGARTMSKLVRDNADRITVTLESAASAAEAIEGLAQRTRPQATLSAITRAADSANRRLSDPKLDKLVAELTAATTRLASLSTELQTVVRQRNRQLGLIMDNLDRASDYLKDFARAVKERPSLLLRGETLKEKSMP